MGRRKRRRVRAVRTPRPAAAQRQRTRSHAAPEPLPVNLLRTLVCGVLFVSLVALKLLLPDNLAPLRGTLGTWLARDADFAAAFSAVGHAVSGGEGALDALEDAYVAVFGEKEATEVSAAAEVEQEASVPEEPAEAPEPQPYPAHAVAEQRVLGFDYASPLTGEVTSPFGWREHPATNRETFHYGVDIAADEGAPVSCFADGTVGVVGESVELGKYLTVHHANGVVSLYAHCSKISAVAGAAVRCGDEIAAVGSTGNATGPHLHFELHDGEDYLNPIYYLS